MIALWPVQITFNGIVGQIVTYPLSACAQVRRTMAASLITARQF